MYRGSFPVTSASSSLPLQSLPPPQQQPPQQSSQLSSLAAAQQQQQQAQQQAQQRQRSLLDQSDFPALNSLPPTSAHWPPNSNSTSSSQQPGQGQNGFSGSTSSFSVDDFPALGGGASSAGPTGGAGSLQSQQEAAHRANLLGSMNGISSSSSGGTTTSSSSLPGGAGQRVGTAGTGVGGGGFGAATTTSTGPPPPPNLGVGGVAGQALPPPTAGAASASLPPPNSSIQQAQQLPSSALSDLDKRQLPISTLPPPSSSQTQPSRIPQTPAQQILFSPADRYGLLGLIHIIKTQDPDLSMMSLGTDLSTLGLDLGTNDPLYSTFLTPWSPSTPSQLAQIEPEFTLPACYNVQPPPAQTKLGNFSDETLFFIFYSCPKDVMQEMAAHELYKHNWRYHKDLRLWLTKEAGTEPTQKTQTYERGSYIFFDPTLWERVRKDFVLVFESLERKNI